MDYTLGCTDYFDWTGDAAFLCSVLPRLRRAMDFAVREFALQEEHCVASRGWGMTVARVSVVTRPAGAL